MTIFRGSQPQPGVITYPVPRSILAVISGLQWSKLIVFSLVGFVVYLVVVPVALLIVGGFTPGRPGDFSAFTYDNYLQAYGNPGVVELFSNSFIFATGSVLVALPIAITFAWLIERTNTPLSNTSYAFVIAPIAMPGMLLSMSWVLLLNPNMGVISSVLKAIFGLEEAPLNIYSMHGMIFIEGLKLVPTTFLLLVGAFRSMDPALEEAAA